MAEPEHGFSDLVMVESSTVAMRVLLIWVESIKRRNVMSTRVNRRQMLGSTALAGAGVWLACDGSAAVSAVTERSTGAGREHLR